MSTNTPTMEVVDGSQETTARAFQPPFSLSETVQALSGHTLTTEQGLILDVAQRLHRNFMAQTAVGTKQVARIASAYHGIRQSDALKVIQELADLGLVSVTKSAGSRSEMKLTMKIKGKSTEQIAETGNAIGFVKPEPVVVPYRERAAEFAFRNTLLRKAAWSFTSKTSDCSIVAAVILAVHCEFAAVDQVSMDRIRKHCEKEGFSVEEITAACRELEDMFVFEFYWCELREQCFVKTPYPTGAQYQIDVADAFTEENAVPPHAESVLSLV